jgi:hypothetical protein
MVTQQSRILENVFLKRNRGWIIFKEIKNELGINDDQLHGAVNHLLNRLLVKKEVRIDRTGKHAFLKLNDTRMKYVISALKRGFGDDYPAEYENANTS